MALVHLNFPTFLSHWTFCKGTPELLETPARGHGHILLGSNDLSWEDVGPDVPHVLQLQRAFPV